MKVLSAILIFYILLISSHPCCEETGKANISSDITEQSSGEHNDGCTDICSPFFTCGSCAGFSNPTLSSSPDPEIVILDSEKPISCAPFEFDYISHIWQPPKIS